MLHFQRAELAASGDLSSGAASPAILSECALEDIENEIEALQQAQKHIAEAKSSLKGLHDADFIVGDLNLALERISEAITSRR